MPISMTVIKPKAARYKKSPIGIPDDKIKAAIIRAFKLTADVLIKDYFYVIDSTWNHRITAIQGPVEFGYDAKTDVTTDDKIFYFLDGGTSVRYAHMSRDFAPKTHVRKYKSTTGSGGLEWVSKDYPLPGIDARRWTNMMAIDINKTLKNNFDAEIRKLL